MTIKLDKDSLTNVIERATIAKALSELNKEIYRREGFTAEEIKFKLLAPEKYEIGQTLFNMAASGTLEKFKVDGKRNKYAITPKGEIYWQKNGTKIQVYGEYEGAFMSKNNVAPVSNAALDAMAMLQKHIKDNENLRSVQQQIINLIDSVLESADD